MSGVTECRTRTGHGTREALSGYRGVTRNVIRFRNPRNIKPGLHSHSTQAAPSLVNPLIVLYEWHYIWLGSILLGLRSCPLSLTQSLCHRRPFLGLHATSCDAHPPAELPVALSVLSLSLAPPVLVPLSALSVCTTPPMKSRGGAAGLSFTTSEPFLMVKARLGDNSLGAAWPRASVFMASSKRALDNSASEYSTNRSASFLMRLTHRKATRELSSRTFSR